MVESGNGPLAKTQRREEKAVRPLLAFAPWHLGVRRAKTPF
jgi:hypothetical protein